jgi:hypothetical protein
VQLGALGLGTVLFQFAIGFFACLIFATTPRVAAHADNKQLVRQSSLPQPLQASTVHVLGFSAC